MFKGFTQRRGFHEFPSKIFGNNEYSAYNQGGVKFWIDAGFGTNTVTNGANVSSWVSRVGGMTATQATAANQPLYVASYAPFNGLPALDFPNYLGRRMFLPFGVTISATYTIAFVIKNDNVDQYRQNIMCSTFSIGAATLYAGGAVAGSNGIGIHMTGGSVPLIASGVKDTAPHIVVITPTEIWVDKVLKGTGSYKGSTSWNLIGGDGGTFGSMMAKLGEIIIWDKILDPQLISDEINAKYAIY